MGRMSETRSGGGSHRARMEERTCQDEPNNGNLRESAATIGGSLANHALS